MIDVLLVDKQRLSSEGIAHLLHKTEDIQVIATARENEETFTKIAPKQPSIIMLNVNKSIMDSIELIKEVKARHSDVKIIVMTPFDNKEFIITCIRHGVVAFLNTNVSADTLFNTIYNVHKGEYVISGEAASILAEVVLSGTLNEEEYLRKALAKIDIHLTHREVEVIDQIRQERTNDRIAEELHISKGTVKNYVSDLYMKTNTSTRQQLIHLLNELLR